MTSLHILTALYSKQAISINWIHEGFSITLSKSLAISLNSRMIMIMW
jgi:hypothetical protein